MRNILILIAVFGFMTSGCTRSLEARAEKIASQIVDELELNDSQKTQLEDIKLTLLSEYREQRSYRMIMNPSVKSFLLSEKLNIGKIKSALASKNKSFEAKLEQHFPMFQDLHKSLSPQQKQKLVNISADLYQKIKKF